MLRLQFGAKELSTSGNFYGSHKTPAKILKEHPKTHSNKTPEWEIFLRASHSQYPVFLLILPDYLELTWSTSTWKCMNYFSFRAPG